jgi:hypothetical protein
LSIIDEVEVAQNGHPHEHASEERDEHADPVDREDPPENGRDPAAPLELVVDRPDVPHDPRERRHEVIWLARKDLLQHQDRNEDLEHVEDVGQEPEPRAGDHRDRCRADRVEDDRVVAAFDICLGPFLDLFVRPGERRDDAGERQAAQEISRDSGEKHDGDVHEDLLLFLFLFSYPEPR